MVERCKIKLLPTVGQPSTMFLNKDGLIVTAKIDEPAFYGTNTLGWIPQHIYVFKDTGNVDQLVATTDPSEFLLEDKRKVTFPTVSAQFIEKYIKAHNLGVPIEEVLVEYTFTKGSSLFSGSMKTVPKVNVRDNTVTIRKVKDLYTRADIDAMIEEIRQPFQYEIRRIILERKNEWLKNNT